MAPPELRYIWGCDVSVLLTADDTKTHCYQNLLQYLFVTQFVDLWEWVVVGSSDGATAGLDGVNRLVDRNDWQWGTGANALSWIVLRPPGYPTGFQLLVATQADFVSSSEKVTISATWGAAFSGGNTTTRPTSADQFNFVNQDSWFGGWTTPADVALHCIFSEDLKCWRVVGYVSATPVFFLSIEEPIDFPAEWTDDAPLVMICQSSTSIAAKGVASQLLGGSTVMRTRVLGTNVSAVTVNALGSPTTVAGGTYVDSAGIGNQISEITGRYAATPTAYISGTTPRRGFLGRARDMWLVQSATLADGDYTAGDFTTRGLAVHSQLLLPYLSDAQVRTPAQQAGTERVFDEIDTGAPPGPGAVVVPNLLSATAVSATVVELVFDSDMANDAELVDPDNYQIVRPNSTLLVTVSVARISATTVRVTCEEMQNGVSYQARVCNMQDLSGNYILVGPDKNQRSFTGVGSGPSVVLIAPTDGATGVTRGIGIVIEITDAASGVDIESVLITVEGVDAFNGGVFGDGFDQGVSKYETISGGYRITLDPDADFSFGQVVNVVVTGSDLAGNPIT